MPISIRNPRVEKLARELAQKRNISMTEVILDSLENAKRTDRNTRPLHERIDEIVGVLHRQAKPEGHALSKDEIDRVWGQE
jgi:antitoxin VapB